MDRADRNRETCEVRLREGWECDNSLRRYDTAVLLNTSASDLTHRQQTLFLHADEPLDDMFFGLRHPCLSALPCD